MGTGRDYVNGVEETISVLIADGQALSEAVDLKYCTLVGIEIPADFDGTALTFQGGATETVTNLYDEAGTEINLPAAASRRIQISNLGLFYGIRHLKVRSGTSATPTNQTGNVTLTLHLRGM